MLLNIRIYRASTTHMNIATFGPLAIPLTFKAALTAYKLKGGHI